MSSLIYISNSRLPTSKAHGLEVMKLVEALNKQIPSRLLAARRFNKNKGDAFVFYGLKGRFPLIRLPILDFIVISFLGKLGYWLESLSFTFSLFLYTVFATRRDDMFLSHENLPLLVVSFVRSDTFYDMHDFPVKGLFWYRLLLKRVRGIITTNNWKKNELQRRFGIPAEKIMVFPNGVEVEKFDIALSKEEARKNLLLPNDKPLIVYTGQLFSWKGVDTLCRAAKLLQDIQVYIVGGSLGDVVDYKKRFSGIINLHFVGQRPHEEMPVWQKAADLLVLPNTALEDISKYFTSPMKLFEYMASGTPLLASDLPSIRQVADEEVASFFMPDDPASLARAAREVFSNQDTTERRSIAALERVKRYTWEHRAEMIIEFYERRKTRTS